MLKLNAVHKDYLWGGEKLKTLFSKQQNGILAESWEVSIHPDGLSTVNGQTFADYLTAHPTAVDKAGSPFGILIKYIDAKSNLSVQVHPGDDYARSVENDNGKTEAWYIVDADEGAGVYCGFNQDVDKNAFLEALAEGSVEKFLNFIPVKKGDCFINLPGIVHAICGGCVVLEVQQSSNVTYRVYDYNRLGVDGKKRPLHIQKAMDVINFTKCDGAVIHNDTTVLTTCNVAQTIDGNNLLRQLAKCEHFNCQEITLCGSAQVGYERSFMVLNIVQGTGTINGQGFCAGDTFFLECDERATICGSAKLVVTTK